MQCLTLGMAAPARRTSWRRSASRLGDLAVFEHGRRHGGRPGGLRAGAGLDRSAGPGRGRRGRGTACVWPCGRAAGTRPGSISTRPTTARAVGAGAGPATSSTSSPTPAGFACHALARPARARAVCVESSPEAVAGARRNFELNGCRGARRDPRRQRLRRAAPARSRARALRPGRARSRRPSPAAGPRSTAALRGYKEINLRALRLLAPGGRLATFSCSHHVDEGDLRGAPCARPPPMPGCACASLERLAQAADHPVLLDRPGDALSEGAAARARVSRRPRYQAARLAGLRIQTRSGSRPRRSASARRRARRLVQRLLGEVERAPVHGDEAPPADVGEDLQRLLGRRVGESHDGRAARRRRSRSRPGRTARAARRSP